MELKKIRLQRGLTQQEVADKIQCSQTVYSRYENGVNEPSIDILLRLSAFFEVSVDYLLGNKSPESSQITKEEWELLVAFRAADDRAREDALTTLQRHSVKKKKERLA